jgi:hypothetical protein
MYESFIMHLSSLHINHIIIVATKSFSPGGPGLPVSQLSSAASADGSPTSGGQLPGAPPHLPIQDAPRGKRSENHRKTIEKDRKTWENPWKSLGNLVGKSTATIVGSSNPVKANGFL